jgi:hypothetical protein
LISPFSTRYFIGIFLIGIFLAFTSIKTFVVIGLLKFDEVVLILFSVFFTLILFKIFCMEFLALLNMAVLFIFNSESKFSKKNGSNALVESK